MSTSVGNICLIITALLFCLLFTPFFHTKISTSNDQGASGYVVIIIMFLHFLMLGLILVACIPVARQGGFDWISIKPFTRNTFLIIGLLAMIIVSALALMYRLIGDDHTPIIEGLIRIAPIVIMVVIVGTGFILNNSSLRDSIPPSVYKWPALIASVGSLISILWMGFTVITTKPIGMAESTRQYENSPNIIENRLSQIETVDITNEMLWLLDLTGGFYPPQVREKAAAKFKTYPEWQNELVRILQTNQALDAFSFIAYNEVEDKSLFPVPVNKGLHEVAVFIRHAIQGTLPDDFEPTMFSDEVDRVLKSISKYEGMGVDYLPAVKEIRSALDEPVAGKVYLFNCSVALDDWIEKHGLNG